MSAAPRIESDRSPFRDATTAELLCRCTRRPADHLAWQEFVRRFHTTIGLSVTRVLSRQLESPPGGQIKLHDRLVGELVDGVYRNLVENRCAALERISQNQPDSIDTYLLMISIRVVRDYLRGRK